MTKQKQSARQAIKTDDVFKVKKKSSKKQSKSKVLKAKSVSEARAMLVVIVT